MTTRAEWDIKHKRGTAREKAFEDLLLSKTVEVILFECKADEMALQTGRVFLEFEQQGRPSGLAVSTADYWAIEGWKGRWLLIPPDDLRLCAAWQSEADPRNVRLGGDNRNRGVTVEPNLLFRLNPNLAEISEAAKARFFPRTQRKRPSSGFVSRCLLHGTYDANDNCPGCYPERSSR